MKKLLPIIAIITVAIAIFLLTNNTPTPTNEPKSKPNPSKETQPEVAKKTPPQKFSCLPQLQATPRNDVVNMFCKALNSLLQVYDLVTSTEHPKTV